jgi:thymidylate synthase
MQKSFLEIFREQTFKWGYKNMAQTYQVYQINGLNIVNINETTIPSAWFQCIYNVLKYGRKFTIDRGSFAGNQRLEFDYITVTISIPGFGSDADIENMLPKLREGSTIPNPVAEGYLADYLPYLMTGELKEGESYTYGQRLNKAPVPLSWLVDYNCSKEDRYCEENFKDILIQEKDIWNSQKIFYKQKRDGHYKVDSFLSQVEMIIHTYKNFGHRNNQMVLQVAQPTDILLQDPPCLRLIDTRIQDGALHFFPEFRSWDLWGGFPANLAAIELLKQYMAQEIGVKSGMIIARSKGLHIYNYVWELAELVANKTYDEAKKSIME